MGRPSREIISVADFDRKLRRAVEVASVSDWIQGEVSALRRVASGHTYFSLKDEKEDAIVDCVMYRFQAQTARRFLDNGSLVQVVGKATVWAPRGKLQLVVEAARPAGKGAILEALERLKVKLAAEGLFERERKRRLPPHPRFVGVVTSADGAAFHDICKVALRRSPVRILLAPALVQGEGASSSLLRALDQLERVRGLEVIIIGRGGGSTEDLMAFNDERLVRRVADCKLPIVSAVGHEIDSCLCDYAADERGATPSEAAELVVPDRSSELGKFSSLIERLRFVARARLEEDRLTLSNLRTKVTDPRFVIAEKQQLLDELGFRMERAVTRRLGTAGTRVAAQRQRLSLAHPKAVLARAKNRLDPEFSKLNHSMITRLRRDRGRVETLSARLEAMSPLSVLSRGYAIVQNSEGNALTSTGSVSVGQPLKIRLASGRLDVKTEAVEPALPESDRERSEIGS